MRRRGTTGNVDWLYIDKIRKNPSQRCFQLHSGPFGLIVGFQMQEKVEFGLFAF